MRSILLAVSLFFTSELTFADIPIFQQDFGLEQQNGNLLFPMLDPKTGKYTDNLERGRQIVEESYQSTFNRRQS